MKTVWWANTGRFVALLKLDDNQGDVIFVGRTVSESLLIVEYVLDDFICVEMAVAP